jgi:anti-anti-sigma factor
VSERDERGLTAGRLDLAAEEATVTLRGELDVARADEVAALVGRAIESGRPRVTVDMAEVRFIDSTVLRVLLSGHRASDEAGSELSIRGLRGHPRKMVELTALHLTLRLDDSEPGEGHTASGGSRPHAAGY